MTFKKWLAINNQYSMLLEPTLPLGNRPRIYFFFHKQDIFFVIIIHKNTKEKVYIERYNFANYWKIPLNPFPLRKENLELADDDEVSPAAR